jgi:hypothetical protein
LELIELVIDKPQARFLLGICESLILVQQGNDSSKDRRAGGCAPGCVKISLHGTYILDANKVRIMIPGCGESYVRHISLMIVRHAITGLP